MTRVKIFSLFAFLILCPALVLAATITGTVTYEGKVPEFREIKIDADPVCVTHHDGPIFPETLVLGEDNTMAHVFIHVVSGLSNKVYPVPTEPAVLDQKGCVYKPHVLGVRVGQPVKILNPDGTLHNVHALPKKNKEFNLAMPKFRKKITRTFDTPEFMFPIKCDVHPWMGAWISVMSHPYFNVTQKDGLYSLDNLPAGKYEMEAWHEKLGSQKVSVVLAEGQTKEINFTFSKPSQ